MRSLCLSLRAVLTGLVALAACAALAGCGGVSQQQEVQMGAQTAQQVNAQLPILNDATEKSLALCSLDSGRCDHCGNPRTGRFCPKCGKSPAKLHNVT